MIGVRSQKVLRDSGAARCIISYDCYNSLHPKYKIELFPSNVKIRAANGMFIPYKGECDVTFKINKERFTFPFLCLDQLSQQMILGHNFSKAYCIGTMWNMEDVMSLTTNDINALVYCTESTTIQPYSNGYIKCRMPMRKGKPYISRSCVFEPSFKHRSLYSHCDAYEGLVAVDDTITSSSVFNIVMTNRSDRHIKIHTNQTMGMLQSCEDGHICLIHKIVSFDRCPKVGRDDTSNLDITKGNLYYIPTRNMKTGRLEGKHTSKEGLLPCMGK